MTRADKRDLAASIKQRLLNLARDTGQDFQALLTRFALERLLYRVGRSPYRDRLLLKGAFLFVAWQDDTHRPTRDLDLLSCLSGRGRHRREDRGHRPTRDYQQSTQGLLRPVDNRIEPLAGRCDPFSRTECNVSQTANPNPAR